MLLKFHDAPLATTQADTSHNSSSAAEENAKTVPPPGLATEWEPHDTRPVSETMPLIGADRATAGGRRTRVRSSGGGLPVPQVPSETSTSMQ